MVKPVISVIVPCYNQAQYLDECLKSVLDQTFQVWECIIVNDGSPDNTEEVARKWLEKDARFSYLRQENKGVSAARNTGITQATGKYVVFLDGDDKFDKDYFIYSIEYLKKGNHIVYSNAHFFGEYYAPWILKPFIKEKLLFENCFFISAIIDRSIFKPHLLFDENMTDGLEDWDFWLRITFNSPIKIFQMEYFGFYYRVKNNSKNQNIISDPGLEEKIRLYMYTKNREIYEEVIGSYPLLLLKYSNLLFYNKEKKKTTKLSFLRKFIRRFLK